MSRLVSLCLVATLGCASTAHARADYPSTMIDIGDIDRAETNAIFAEAEKRVAAGERTLMFRLNSFGGSVFAGMDFIQNLEQLKREKQVWVICAVDSRAMSMGFIFLQAVCDERLMTKRSLLMAHSASTSIEGNAVKVADDLAFLLALDRSLAEIAAERMKLPVLEYMLKTNSRDWTMGWEEALDIKAVDAIVSHKELPPVFKAPKLGLLFTLGL